MNTNCCYACRVSIKKNICSNGLQIVLCDDCIADATNILISKHNAKKKFNLNENDLANMPHNICKKNKNTYIKYYYDDVLSKAYKKYGGITSYIKNNGLLLNPDKYSIDTNFEMKKCRADLIFGTLNKLNCDYKNVAEILYDYIEYGDDCGYDYNKIYGLLERKKLIY